MVESVSKKRKVSKKTKKSWRKHVNTKDVDAFLENKRLEERLGTPFALRKDDELFLIDKTRNNDIVLKENIELTKQERRELMKQTEPKCFALLKPFTAVPDPIVKRNRVKTPEERKCTIRKTIENKKRSKGLLKLKERLAIQNRQLTKKKRANKPKRGEFKIDIWKEEPIVEPELKSEWLSNDTVRHTLTNTGKKTKRIPKSVQKKPSIIPAINAPHPGISYNPSVIDHQELLTQIAADEMKIMKEEKHLDRVTNKMFRKVTAKQKDEDNLKEMSEGLPLKKSEIYSSDEEDDLTIKSINPPVKNAKKTLIQRRKQKEQRKLEQQKMIMKVEKRKVADIYHLKQISKQITKKQKKVEFLKEKRLKTQAKKELEPKILSRHKYVPLEQEFCLKDELSGNLRNTQPAGNLLKDRYKSLQQRNIVAPGTVQLKKNKSKVKRFIKPDHKIDLNTPKNKSAKNKTG